MCTSLFNYIKRSIALLKWEELALLEVFTCLLRHPVITLVTDQRYQNTDLQALTLVGPTRENQVHNPLAVQHPDN